LDPVLELDGEAAKVLFEASPVAYVVDDRRHANDAIGVIPDA